VHISKAEKTVLRAKKITITTCVGKIEIKVTFGATVWRKGGKNVERGGSRKPRGGPKGDFFSPQKRIEWLRGGALVGTKEKGKPFAPKAGSCRGEDKEKKRKRCSKGGFSLQRKKNRGSKGGRRKHSGVRRGTKKYLQAIQSLGVGSAPNKTGSGY